MGHVAATTSAYVVPRLFPMTEKVAAGRPPCVIAWDYMKNPVRILTPAPPLEMQVPENFLRHPFVPSPGGDGACLFELAKAAA